MKDVAHKHRYTHTHIHTDAVVHSTANPSSNRSPLAITFRGLGQVHTVNRWNSTRVRMPSNTICTTKWRTVSQTLRIPFKQTSRPETKISYLRYLCHFGQRGLIIAIVFRQLLSVPCRVHQSAQQHAGQALVWV